VPNAMVVDDSRAVRMVIRRALHGLGFQVIEAANGREALETLDQSNGAMDLILTDWNMPVMNGLDLIKAIRGRSNFAHTPVIMVSTETEVDQMSCALEAGASEYVMKPFNDQILADKLRLAGVTLSAPPEASPRGS
jgi:two-component system chemotaxis response regulator CheY